jgi:3-hydroxyisobutyrate dehydrogenase-like beta-hydroxyacid dehydrogenase
MSESTKPSIGFMVLVVGWPMAQNLPKSGYTLEVNDINSAAVKVIMGADA